MKQLNEKVAIITGAGQGIGRGIALCLGKRGVKIVCVGRRIAPIEETASLIKAEGSDAIAVSCDVSDKASVENAVKQTVEKFGTVDILINGAQTLPVAKLVEDVTYEDMLLAWQTGTIGSMYFMQACFPYMKEQMEGRIINFASATGMFGYPTHLAYGSNKESIRGMTKIAAKEWGQYNICVNCVLPGAESPAQVEWSKNHAELYKKILREQPMHRFGKAEEDIGPVVAFLAGPDSCYYSGQSLLIDGASSIAP